MSNSQIDSEDKIHTECYCWFHNEYPALRGLLCYNLGNSKNAIDGARNRAKGLQKGRSDLVLYFNEKAYMIELKNTYGEQSNEQKDWELAVQIQGFQYFLIRSLSEFQELIKKILYERRPTKICTAIR